MCKTSRIWFLDPECMMHVAIEFSQVKNTRRMESSAASATRTVDHDQYRQNPGNSFTSRILAVRVLAFWILTARQFLLADRNQC